MYTFSYPHYTPQQLAQGEEHVLKSRDCFSLLMEKYSFMVDVEGKTATTNNKHTTTTTTLTTHALTLPTLSGALKRKAGKEDEVEIEESVPGDDATQEDTTLVAINNNNNNNNIDEDDDSDSGSYNNNNNNNESTAQPQAKKIKTSDRCVQCYFFSFLLLNFFSHQCLQYQGNFREFVPERRPTCVNHK